MIRYFLRRAATAMGKRYDYDVSYMQAVIDASANAGVRLAAYPMVTQYRGPSEAANVTIGAMFASILDGDCGPCAQLVVDMATEAGADPAQLQRCALGQALQAGDTGLGFRFAQAAIAGTPDADDLRAEIAQKYGDRAVVAAALAAATTRMYPVLKRGLGYGKSCQRLSFAGQDTDLTAKLRTA